MKPNGNHDQPRMDSFGLTDAGCRRNRNDDQYLVAQLQRSLLVHRSSLVMAHDSSLRGQVCGHVFAVADGIGAGADGSMASAAVLDALAHHFLDRSAWSLGGDEPEPSEVRAELEAAIESSQRRLARVAAEREAARRTGTSLTLACLFWPNLLVAHVGDSRCYLLRDGTLLQVTNDHTVAARLSDLNLVDPAAMPEETHDALVHSLMADPKLSSPPEHRSLALALGDVMLLCSDGLPRMVESDEIAGVLDRAPSAEQACRDLVARAKAAGGEDNVTAVVARFDDASGARMVLAEPKRVTRPRRLPTPATPPFTSSPRPGNETGTGTPAAPGTNALSN